MNLINTLNMQDLPSIIINKLRVCEKHFKENDFKITRSNKKQLNVTATPSIFPNLIESET